MVTRTASASTNVSPVAPTGLKRGVPSSSVSSTAVGYYPQALAAAAHGLTQRRAKKVTLGGQETSLKIVRVNYNPYAVLTPPKEGFVPGSVEQVRAGMIANLAPITGCVPISQVFAYGGPISQPQALSVAVGC